MLPHLRTLPCALATVVFLFAKLARAESFAFTPEGVESPVWLERVAVVHSGEASVTTVSIVADPAATMRLVELPEGTAVASLTRVASPFPDLDALLAPRYVTAYEIDPCDMHLVESTKPAATCAGVPGASDPAAKPIAVWDALFSPRTRLAPVAVVAAQAIDAANSMMPLGITLPRRARDYAKLHPRAVFALTEAEAIAFSGTAPSYVWPSRTGPDQGGAAWVELTVLDRERLAARLPALRRARVSRAVRRNRDSSSDESTYASFALAREALSRADADVVELVSAPHSCLLDATNETLGSLGFAELPPGRAPVGFDPSTIPPPKTVEYPCPKRSPPHIQLSGPCVPSTSLVSPDPKLHHVPAFWPSVSRWLGPSGKALELDFVEPLEADPPLLTTIEHREPWHGEIRCKTPKRGRFTGWKAERQPLPVRLTLRTNVEPSFESLYEPTFALSVVPASRTARVSMTDAALAEPSLPPRPASAPAPASPGPPGPPPVPKASACACDAVGESGGIPLDGSAFVVAVVAFCAVLKRTRRAALL